MIAFFTDWMQVIRMEYGVNPYIFISIYLMAIPLFWAGIYWLVQNYKKQKSLVYPILFIGSCLISSYVYLLTAGENLPLWVYLIIILMVIYGAYSMYNSVKAKLRGVKHG